MAAEILAEMYRYAVSKKNAAVEDIVHNLSLNSVFIDNKPVRLRLINKDDIDLWAGFVRSCSSRSLWLRFLTPFIPTPELAQRFCDIDPENEIAIAAEIEDEEKKFVGIARLSKETNEEVEYAVIVSDSWQRKSLGRILSKQCIELAKNRGYKTVRAETVKENFAILRIFRDLKFQLERKDDNMLCMALNF